MRWLTWHEKTQHIAVPETEIQKLVMTNSLSAKLFVQLRGGKTYNLKQWTWIKELEW